MIRAVKYEPMGEICAYTGKGKDVLDEVYLHHSWSWHWM
jgi:hypothetical protein